MDTNELLKKRSDLEKRLSALVTAELNQFQHETGFPIKSVNVQQVTSWKVGEPYPEWNLSKVICEIDLHA